jgi:hypothetical protein
MSSDEREPLILRRRDISGRIEEIFEIMNTDAELREQFVTDPAQVLSTYVKGAELPPQQASAANQLVYSVMSNPRLLDWFSSYAQEHAGEAPSRHQFMTDFSQAVIEHGGDHVVLSLIRGSLSQGAPGPGIAATPGIFITSSPLIASGFLVKTDQRAQTDSHATQSFDTRQDSHQITSASQGAVSSAIVDSGTSTSSDSATSTSSESATSTSSESATSTSSESATSTSSESATDAGTESAADSETHVGAEADTAGIRDTWGIYASDSVRIAMDALARYAAELSRVGELDTFNIDGGR